MKFFILSFFTILALLFLWGTGFGIFATYSSMAKPYDINQHSSAIVVLSGGRDRFENGFDLFAGRRALYMFITSVHKSTTAEDLAGRWREWIYKKGRASPPELPVCCIVLDHDATTTAQNAIMTKQWVEAVKSDKDQDIQSIRLVTSNYHMPRALVDFNRILPDVVIYPHPVVSPGAGFSDKAYWMLLLDEYNKFLLRALQSALPLSMQELGA